MPNIPDAASYVAPLGQGFQIGTQWQAQRERSREALANEALAQQQQGIAQAQEGRTQQEFQQAQDASRFLQTRFQQRQGEEALKAQDTPDGGVPYTPKEPADILREIYPEAAARFPGSALEKVLPVIQRQMITPYQQQQIDLGRGRLGIQQQRADTAEDYGGQRIDIAQQRADDMARQGDVRNDLRRAAIKSSQQSQLRALQAQTGEPIFDPQTQEFDAEAYQRALKKAGESFTFNKQMTPQERQVDRILKADPFYKDKTPEELEDYRGKLIANGGKPFALSPSQESDIQKSNQVVRGIEKLNDAVDAYKGDFGPGFWIKNKAGKILGTSEKEQQLAQIYSQISSGKAFDVGGKTLTPTELGAILTTIGDPSNPQFRERVKDYLQSESEKHAQQIEVLKEGGYETNPKYRGQVKSYIENLDRVQKKLSESGRSLSENFTGDGKNKPTVHDLGNGVKVTVERVN
jgi:hypothetical protein